MPSKTWTDRLNDPAPHVVKPVAFDFAGMKRGEVMLVPTARMVDAFNRKIPSGKHVSVVSLRSSLAKRYRAEVCCAIYTGYHLRTVAEAACEAHRLGKPLADITPFWRVIDLKTPTAKRLACGIEFIRKQRQSEGLLP